MSALLLTADGDLDVSSRSLVITKDVGVVTAQKLQGRILMFLGEWFLDTRIGFPWVQLVYGVKAPDLRALKLLMNRALMSVKSVETVTRLDLDFDPATRELTYTWEVFLNDGTALESGEGTPFILEIRGTT